MKSKEMQDLVDSIKPFKTGCATCGSEKIALSDFSDELSRKEFKISGMCQKCQDSIFVEHEPEHTEPNDESAF